MKKIMLILLFVPPLLTSCKDNDGVIDESIFFWYKCDDVYVCGSQMSLKDDFFIECPELEKYPFIYSRDEFRDYLISYDGSEYSLALDENESMKIGYDFYAADVNCSGGFEVCYCYTEVDNTTNTTNYCVRIYDLFEKNEIANFKGDTDYDYCIETDNTIAPLKIIKYKKGETSKSENREVGRYLLNYDVPERTVKIEWKSQKEYEKESKHDSIQKA